MRCLLRKARWLLRRHPDIMMLADRGFANHDFLSWLQKSNWHYCIRIPCESSRRCRFPSRRTGEPEG
jgi:Transposase DDE domain